MKRRTRSWGGTAQELSSANLLRIQTTLGGVLRETDARLYDYTAGNGYMVRLLPIVGVLLEYVGTS
jgi:hypothetical protein